MLKFTMEKKDTFSYFGVQARAKGGSVFVPGLFCQFVVKLCTEFNVFLVVTIFIY